MNAPGRAVGRESSGRFRQRRPEVDQARRWRWESRFSVDSVPVDLRGKGAARRGKLAADPMTGLIIREAQKEALARAEWLRYQQQLCAYLRQRDLPGVAGLEERALFQRAGVAIARARRYGINLDWAVAAFACWMFAISPRFDEQPAIAALLQDTSLDPNQRVHLLPRLVSEEDWEQAAAIAGDDVWTMEEPD